MRFQLALSPFALAALASPLVAQSWTQQYPPALPASVDVEALSAIHAWVALANGVLRHTTDGGVAWTDVSIGAASLAAVRFVNANQGWAAGSGIWRTTDGGQAWTQTSSRAVRELSFPNATTGIALGVDGHALTTSDGGASWIDRGAIASSASLRDVHRIASGRSWACGAAGALLTSADGAAPWSALSTGTTADLASVFFLDASNGWIAAGNRIRRTSDGGASWSVLAVPANAPIEDVLFLTTTRGWAVASDGQTFSTSDGGATWTIGANSGSGALSDLDFVDFFGGYAVGASGRVLKSSDGGASWTQVAGGNSAPLPTVFGMDAVDAHHAWATTYDDAILRTDDGGATWAPIENGVNFQWRDVSFVDALHGYACGKKQAFFPAIAWTDDGGLSWNRVWYGMMVDFNDVEALSPTTALVTGDTFVWRTTDGGLSWPSVSPTPFGTYHGMSFADSQTGWIAGTQIFRTDDAGATWTHQGTPAATMWDVGFANAQVGWCVGAGGTVMKTIDGGTTWTTSSVAGFTGDLQSVSVVDAQTLWIAGGQGFVARSTDGGASFTAESMGTGANAYPYAAKFVDADTGWVAGYFETPLMKRTGSSCAAPVAYCTAKVNSAGTTCHLGASGSPSFAAGGFALTFAGALPSQSGIFAYSTSGEAAAPFFNGTRCIATPLTRLSVFNTGPSGTGSFAIPITAPMTGTTRWYQLFYRDVPNPDGTGMGLSDGLRVTFCP